MERISDKTMAEIRKAVEKIAHERNVQEEQEFQEFEKRVKKIFAFDSPNAGEKLIKWIDDGEGLSPQQEILVIQALADGRLSEAEFLVAVESFYPSFDDRAITLLLQYIGEGKISESLLVNLIQEKAVLKSEVSSDFVDAVADKKISSSLLVMLAQKRYDFSRVKDDVASYCVEGKLSVEIISQMLTAGFRFSVQGEGYILYAVAHGTCSEDILKKMLNKVLFFQENSLLLVEGVLFGNISEDLLLEMSKNESFSKEAVLLMLQAVQKGRLSEVILRNAVEDRDDFGLETWQKLFDSGIDFLVSEYIRLFYPELEGKFEL